MPGDDHESAKHLMRARGLVDVLIPRGGAGLIRSVVEESTVPVIETGVGNCHVYVDADADLDMAIEIILNAKTQRPSVCNAAETMLVHADVAAEFLPRALKALQAAGVTIHGDEDGRVVRRGGRPGDRRGLGGGVPLARPRRRRRPEPSATRSRTSGGGEAGTPRRSSPARCRHRSSSSRASTPPR